MRRKHWKENVIQYNYYVTNWGIGERQTKYNLLKLSWGFWDVGWMGFGKSTHPLLAQVLIEIKSRNKMHLSWN